MGRKLRTSVAPAYYLFVLLGVFYSSTIHAFSYSDGDFSFTLKNRVSIGANFRVEERQESEVHYAYNNNVVFGDELNPRYAELYDPEVYGSKLSHAFLPQQSFKINGYVGVPVKEEDASTCATADVTAAEIDDNFLIQCTRIAFAVGEGRNDYFWDDGNLNYDRGIVSQQFRTQHEMDIRYNEVGAYFKAYAFYDYYVKNKTLDYAPLSDDADEVVGSDARLVDAYIYGDFYVLDMPFSFKLGDQTIMWGEGLLTSDINGAINSEDWNQIFMPGGEGDFSTQSAFAISASYNITDNIKTEAYLQTEFVPSTLPPRGYYISPLDLVGAGSDRFCTGSGGRVPEAEAPVCVFKSGETLAKNDGQYGFRFSFIIPQLADTEVSLIFANYHSKLPTIQGISGLPSSDDTLPDILKAKYSLIYPENKRLYGLTWVATIPFGLSFSGELSYQKDVPLIVNVPEIYIAMSGQYLNFLDYTQGDVLDNPNSFVTGLGDNELVLAWFLNWVQSATGDDVDADAFLAAQDTDYNQIYNKYPGQLGMASILTPTVINGFINRDVVKSRMTLLSYLGGSWIGASSVTLASELAMAYIVDHPEFDEYRLLSWSGEGRGVPDPLPTGLQEVDSIPTNWTDDLSMQLTLAIQMDYPSVFEVLDINMVIGYQSGISGEGPVLSGYSKTQKNGRFQMDARYGDQIGFGMAYTKYMADRDWVTLHASYSF